MARRRSFTDKEVLAQLPAARARTARERAEGLHALSADYDPARRRVVMEMSSGYVFGFPAAGVSALKGASPAELREVELSPSGSGLHWERLDVDLDVPTLLMSALGRKARARALARMAGSVSTEKKASAARANGARGGRPAARRLATGKK